MLNSPSRVTQGCCLPRGDTGDPFLAAERCCDNSSDSRRKSQDVPGTCGCLVRVCRVGGSLSTWPSWLVRPSCVCSCFPGFALIRPCSHLRPCCGQELMFCKLRHQEVGEMVLPHVVSLCRNLNHSFALIGAAERPVAASMCVWCRSCPAGCGQGERSGRGQSVGAPGQAGEQVRLGVQAASQLQDCCGQGTKPLPAPPASVHLRPHSL